MTKKTIIQIFLILIFFLIGCTEQQEITSTPVDNESGYPLTNTQNADAYPPGYDSYQMVIDFEDLEPPTEAKSPEEGKASISGLLYQTQGSMILKNLDFFLSPAVLINEQPVVSPIITYPDVEKGDIAGKTDANGVFYLNNISPGDYFLVIVFPDRTVVAKPNQASENELLISLSEGDQIPLGVLFIND